MAIFNEQIALAITAQTGGAVQPLGQLQQQAKQTETSFDRMAKSIGISSSTLKTGLVAGATALVGTGLVGFLQNSVNAYTDAAQAAGQLANATNANIESASRFAAVTSKYGLDLSDLTEIFADFQQAAGASSKELETLGVGLTKTASGATDWVATATDFLAKMQEIPDATERNRLMFKFFGEEGAKQLMGLVNSGKSVKESLEAISDTQIMRDADLRNAQEFKASLAELQSSAADLGITVGRTLVPVLTTLSNVLQPLASGFASLDSGTLALGGTAILVATQWGRITAAVAVAGTALRGLGNAVIKPLTVDFTGLTLAAGASAKAIDANTAAAARSRGMGLTGWLVALTVAWEVASRAVSAYGKSIDAVAASTDQITEATAQATLESQSLWEKLGGAIKDILDPGAWAHTLTFGLTGTSVEERTQRDLVKSQEEAAAAMKQSEEAATKAAEAQGAYAVATKEAGDTQAELKRLIAEGSTDYAALSAAATSAATAQEKQAAATKAASDAMDAAVVTTEELWTATLALFDADYAHQQALWARQDAVKEAIKVTEDEESSRRKVAESIHAVAAASLEAAQSYVAEKTASMEAAGQFVSDQEKRTLLIDSLKRQLDAIPDSLPKAQQAVRDLIAGLESANIPPLTIDGIQFKEGTTQAAVQDLQTRIARALDYGDTGLATKLQGQLDALKMPPMPVTLTGPGGEPLGEDVGVKINVDSSQIDTARAALTGLEGDREIKYQTTVHNVANTTNVLTGLMGDREVKFNTVVRGDDHTKRVLDGLAGDREVKFNTVVRNVENTQNVLNGLDNPRDVYFRVHVTGAGEARATMASIQQTSQMGALLSPMGVTPMAAAAPMAVNTSQTFSINVSGAGNPATTAREIERYIRRAGDRSKVSVSG